MPSIFHIKANTAEEMRAHVVSWLKKQAEIEEKHNNITCHTKREQVISAARVNTLNGAARFFADLNIDPIGEKP